MTGLDVPDVGVRGGIVAEGVEVGWGTERIGDEGRYRRGNV